ncbi:hypothetical protein [Oceanobacillus massiliensis]|uniref:hypothetical protein n=1 Tax=Oceanobacillus massiliensis TaxID=1465765 RepID=UPI003018C12F
MLIELLSDLLNECSPIYLYLSLLVTIIQFELIQLDDHNKMFKNDVQTRKSHALRFQLLPLQKINAAMIDIRNWIANRTKRIEIPDDDKEDPSFSISHSNINRGGVTWKQLLYSPNLKNIAC